MKKNRIIFASNNDHKVKEINQIMASLCDYEIITPKMANLELVDVDENGKTYKENAYLKVVPFIGSKEMVMADDSGVEISTLGKHFPGIHTKRYAQDNGGQLEVNKKLSIMAMQEKKKIKATFYCVMCLLDEKGKVHYFKGVMKGRISPKIEGGHGFGYDPIFIEKSTNKVVATLEDSVKNKVSHRYKALKKLVRYLHRRYK